MTQGLDRIILHWTAGGARASVLDLQHYHFVVEQDLRVTPGVLNPEANISTRDGSYAAHTLNCNTGSIGVALCGMALAQDAPLALGRAPITAPQVDAACAFVATLCRKYGIEVTRRTVLSHAEVQPTLGIRQNGKWDIRWLPGMAAIADAVAVGDVLRAKIAGHL